MKVGMIQFLNKAICWLIGHKIEMRRHYPPDRAETRFQVVCERCMQQYGVKTINHVQAQTVKSASVRADLENWLINVIPERTKKRMYKKAKEIYG